VIAELVRSIVAANVYLTLATADVHCSPWACRRPGPIGLTIATGVGVG
jgi:hypothetical protein